MTALKEDTIIIKRFRFQTLFTGLVPLFVLAHFSHHVITALTIPLLPFIRNDFTLDYTQSGLVVSAFSLAYRIFHIKSSAYHQLIF